MRLSQEYKDRLKAAAKQVADDLIAMSPGEFAAEIERHKGGDIGLALAATGMFDPVDQVCSYHTIQKYATGLNTRWLYVSADEGYNDQRAMAA